MAKCRHCGNSGWTIRTNSAGLCRTCHTRIRAEVNSRLARLKDSLIHIRCTKDYETLLSLCDAGIADVRELLNYERRRLLDITPKPSALLAMLEAKRDEVRAEGPPRPRSETCSTHTGPPSGRATPPFKPGGLEPSGPGVGPEGASGALHRCQPEHLAESRTGEWWAWDQREDEELDSNPKQRADESRDDRKAVRERMHCFVLLDPGGIRATLENLSTGGLFLCAPRLRPPGSRVRLILSTAQGPLQAEGVVRWVREKSPTGSPSGPPGMGIEFTRCSPELRLYLGSRFPSVKTSNDPPTHAPRSVAP